MTQPRFYIENVGTSTRGAIEAHLYFTVENGKTPVVDTYYLPVGNVSLEHVAGDDYRLVFDYSGAQLGPGQRLPDAAGGVVGLHYQDWSAWQKSNDWFLDGVSDQFAQTSRVAVLENGQLICGSSPFESAPSPSQPNPPVGPPACDDGATCIDRFLSLPSGSSLSDVLLAGQAEIVRLADGTHVEVVPGLGPTTVVAGGGGLNLGVGGQVDSVVSAGLVELRNDSLVRGNVVANGAVEKQAGAQVLGKTLVDQSTPFESLPVRFRFATGGTEVNLEPHQVATLAPGRFTTVRAKEGSILTLLSGVHFIDHLELNTGSRLVIDDSAPIAVFVKDSIVFRAAIEAADGGSADWLLGFAGTNPVALETAFSGTVVAPAAFLTLGIENEHHQGSFFANGVEVRRGGTLTHVQYGGWSELCAELDVDDGALCAQIGESAEHTFPSSTSAGFDLPSHGAVGPGDISIFGSNDVDIGTGAVVSGGDGTVVLAGAGGATVGDGVETTTLVSQGPVVVGSGVVVPGGITSAGPIEGVPQEGPVNGGQNVAPYGTVACSTVFAPSTYGHLDLQPGRSRILFPGRYGSIRVQPGASLYLEDGTYHFDSLIVESGASVVMGSGGGVATVYVRSRLGIGGSVVPLGRAISTTQLVVLYAGEATAELAGSFEAHIVAPNARLQIAGGAALVGSFFGKSVAVAPSAQVTHAPMPYEQACGVARADDPVVAREAPPAALVAQACTSSGNQPASYVPGAPIRFRIPERLHVRNGNAGNHPATLTYTTVGGTTVTCGYVGGASVAHPTTRVELAKGTEYEFTGCSNGASALSVDTASSFELEIGADCDFGLIGGTTVAFNPDVTQCQEYMGSFIAPGEAISMLESFSWENTSAVAEYNADGTPTLYYATVFVESTADIDMLDALLIHNQPFPLFQSEYPADFFDSCGAVTTGGDMGGEWRFAVIPGAVYNRLRQLVVDTDLQVEGGDRELFRAVVLRQAPGASVSPNGSLSYSALRESGFQWRLHDTEVASLPAVEALNTTVLRSASVAAHVVNVFEFVYDTAVEVVALVMQGVAYLDGWLAGTVPVTIDFDIPNPDDTFGDGLMRWGWGPRAGQELSFDGATVNLFQVTSRIYTAGLPMPKLYSGEANRSGQVRFHVAENNWTGGTYLGALCVTLHNRAARMSQFIVEKMWCDIPAAEILEGGEPTGERSTILTGFSQPSRVRIDGGNNEFHMLAEFHEGQTYAAEVLGNEPPKAHVNSGLTAYLGGTNASAMCLRVSGFHWDDAVDFSTVASGISQFGHINPDTITDALAYPYITLLMAADIVLPYGTEAREARGVASHEYGHFVFCSEMAEATEAFAYPNSAPRGELFTKLYVQTILGEGHAVQEDDDARIINEGLADFFAGQVLGGTDYFGPPNSSISAALNGVCTGAGSTCVDANADSDVSGSQPARALIAGVATTLHDIFDGHYSNSAAGRVKARVTPTNGDSHLALGNDPFVVTQHAYGNAYDEAVALGGRAYRTIVREFVRRTDNNLLGTGGDDQAYSFSDDAFRDAMAAGMRRSGVSWCDACRVMALHEEQQSQETVHAQWEHCAASHFADALGPAPQEDLRMSRTCEACPAGSVTREQCIFTGEPLRGTACTDWTGPGLVAGGGVPSVVPGMDVAGDCHPTPGAIVPERCSDIRHGTNGPNAATALRAAHPANAQCRVPQGTQVAGPCSTTNDLAGQPLVGVDTTAEVCELDAGQVPGPCRLLADALGNPVNGTNGGDAMFPTCELAAGTQVAGPCRLTRDALGEPLPGTSTPFTYCELPAGAWVAGGCGVTSDGLGNPLDGIVIPDATPSCSIVGGLVPGPCSAVLDGAGVPVGIGNDITDVCELVEQTREGPCWFVTSGTGVQQGPGRLLNDDEAPQSDCIACPVLHSPDGNNDCTPCGVGEIVEGGQCVACAPNEIVQNNACVPCPLGTGPDTGRVACIPCAIDAQLDLTTVTTCSDIRSVSGSGASANDNCPGQFWVEVTAADANVFVEVDITQQPDDSMTCLANGVSMVVDYTTAGTQVTIPAAVPVWCDLGDGLICDEWGCEASTPTEPFASHPVQTLHVLAQPSAGFDAFPRVVRGGLVGSECPFDGRVR